MEEVNPSKFLKATEKAHVKKEEKMKDIMATATVKTIAFSTKDKKKENETIKC